MSALKEVLGDAEQKVFFGCNASHIVKWTVWKCRALGTGL